MRPAPAENRVVTDVAVAGGSLDVSGDGVRPVSVGVVNGVVSDVCLPVERVNSTTCTSDSPSPMLPITAIDNSQVEP